MLDLIKLNRCLQYISIGFPNLSTADCQLSLILLTMENKEEETKSIKNSESPMKIIKDIKHELGDYRNEFDKMWKIYDDAYYGKQHKTGEGIKTVKNHIFKIIDAQVATLTDSMPSTQVTATREDKQQAAEILGKAIKFVYQDQNLQLLLPSLIRSSLISGPGYLYVSYNPDGHDGEGRIEYKQLPWSAVFLDGNAPLIEQSERVRIEIPLRKEFLARTWPEKSDEIMKIKGNVAPDSADDANFEKRDVSGRLNELGKPKKFSGKDIVKYVETWVKSYDLEDIDPEETEEELKEENEQLRNSTPPDISKWDHHDKHIEKHSRLRAELLSVIGLPPDASFEEAQNRVEELLQSNPQATDLQAGLLTLKILDNHLEEHEELKKLNPTSQAPKYEDGWRVIKSVEDIILYDGENPEENGEIPLIPFYSYKDETIYGFGEVKNILNAQQTLNDMDFREFEGLKMCSNPGWIADHEAEVDEKSLTNAPGIVVLKKRGTEVRRLEAGQISPQLEQRKQLDQQAMESISGMNEQTMNGAMPAGNASGVAISKIQNQAIGRIRLKGRGLEYYSMRRLALITASFIMNHWTQEKELRLRTDDNQIESVTFNPLEMEDLNYTMDVTPGSMAGIDKDALTAFYLMLLNNQHINFDMFLAASPEFPGKHTLVKLTKDNNQMMQQVEQAKQQYEQVIQQQNEQAQQLQAQNLKLKGAFDLKRQASIDLMSGKEKQLFDSISKQDQANKLAEGNMEPIMANQNNQGMM